MRRSRPLPGLTIAPELLITGAFRDFLVDDGGNATGTIVSSPHGVIANLTVTYDVAPHVQLFAIGRNLFYSRFEPVNGYQTPGPSFLAGVRVQPLISHLIVMRSAIDPPRGATRSNTLQSHGVQHARHSALGSRYSDPDHHPALSVPCDLTVEHRGGGLSDRTRRHLGVTRQIRLYAACAADRNTRRDPNKQGTVRHVCLVLRSDCARTPHHGSPASAAGRSMRSTCRSSPS